MSATQNPGVSLAGTYECSRSELGAFADPITANAVAIAGAAADAGIDVREIDGLLTYDSLVAPDILQANRVAEYAGISPSLAATVGAAGATPATALVIAASLISTGSVSTVAVAHADLRSAAGRDKVIAAMAKNVGNPQFEAPFGPIIPTMYALLADWMLGATDVTAEDLAEIAVQSRRWAALNPNAVRPRPLTIEEVLEAPRVAGILGKYDCCLVTDFAGAFIVTGHPIAADEPAVRLRAWSGSASHEELSQVDTTAPLAAAEEVARVLYERAGLGPVDIDVALLYDSFTSTVAQQLLAYGFAERSSLRSLLQRGIGPGGALPVNTHGGLLAGSTSGLFHLVEAVRQLRGRAGERQVSEARTALVTNVGGVFSNHCAVLLERS